MDFFWSYVYPTAVQFVWLVDFMVTIHNISNNWGLLTQIHTRSIWSLLAQMQRENEIQSWAESFQHLTSALLLMPTWPQQSLPPCIKLQDNRSKSSYHPCVASQDACFWTECRHLPWAHKWGGHPYRKTHHLLVPSTCCPEANCGGGIK